MSWKHIECNQHVLLISALQSIAKNCYRSNNTYLDNIATNSLMHPITVYQQLGISHDQIFISNPCIHIYLQ